MMRGTGGGMNMGACVGLRQTIAANRNGISGDDNYRTNTYMGKNFYSDENYRAALERMDGGYDIATDLIEIMEDYYEIEKAHSHSLTAHSKKWISRLKQQSTLSSYHTTKRAQHQTVRIAERLASVDEDRCKSIRVVIEKFRKYIDENYVSGRFGRGHVHRRTSEFKKLFKSAHASLTEVAKQLEHIVAQETRAQEELHKADSAREIIDSDPTATESQQTRAENLQKKRQATLAAIERQVEHAREAHTSAKRTYRKKVKDIFQQCQKIEEERLDHIKDTLVDLVQAMHSEQYAPKLQTIYDDLTSNITTKQNSFDDLLFWAQVYGVLGKQGISASSFNDVVDEEDEDVVPTTPIDSRPTTRSNRHSKKSVTDETENLNTSTVTKTTKNNADDDKQQTVADDDEDPSGTAAATTKSKAKRTKANTATDKKNNTGAESTLPNNTAPIQCN